MSTGSDVETKVAPKKSLLSTLAWWRVDPVELEKQVGEYDTLGITKSARGVSALYCAFTVAVTGLFGTFIGLDVSAIVIEVVVWSVVGLFMYLGHRWAFVLGLILWTYEKGYSLVQRPNVAFVQVLWWGFFMSSFFLALRVESSRRARLRAIDA